MNTKEYKGYELFPITHCEGRKICVQIRAYKNNTFQFETPVCDNIKEARTKAKKAIDNIDTMKPGQPKIIKPEMDSQTYTQRVQDLAEKMAREKFKHSSLFKYKDDVKYPATNETIKKEIESTLPAARIAVAEMAAMFERGFKIGKFNYIDETWEQLPPDEIEPFRGLMKANGLIRDNAKEGGQDGNS